MLLAMEKEATTLINKNGELSAISETIVAHVDMDSRRTSDMSDEFYCKVKTIKESHDRTVQ